MISNVPGDIPRRNGACPILQILVPGLLGAAVLGAAVMIGVSGPPKSRDASAMSAAGVPEPLRGLPGYTLEVLDGPIKIGIQPGHWRIEELPDEQARLRTSTGAAYGSLRELDLNLAVSRILVDRLAAAGYTAELVPAAVPAGYRADLFVSVHADRADRPDRRGWKLSPPWRPSPESRRLANTMVEAFRASGLAEDRGGVTANMRGYFGFSWWRYSNALSPYTPAVLVEMGFLGNPEDRVRMRDNPSLYAGILFEGIQSFLAGSDREDLDALVPVLYRVRSAGPGGAAGRASPSFGSAVLESYPSGRYLSFVDSDEGGWFEVFSRPLRRGVWVHESELDGE